MIWQLCFVSVPYLFQIDLYYTPELIEKTSSLPIDISWTNSSAKTQVNIQTNLINTTIDRCSSQTEFLVARCSSTSKDVNDPIYQCDRIEPDHRNHRSKRNTPTKSKRSSGLFLGLIIGIPCFAIGIVAGIAVTIYICLQRRNQQTQGPVESVTPNNPMVTAIKQNTAPTKSPVTTTSTYPAVRQEREMPKPAVTQYKTLPNRTAPPPASTNTSTMKTPWQQPYKRSNNLQNNQRNRNSIYRLRSKSC